MTEESEIPYDDQSAFTPTQKIEPEYWMASCQSCGKGKLLRVSRVVFNEKKTMMIAHWVWRCKNPECGYEVR